MVIDPVQNAHARGTAPVARASATGWPRLAVLLGLVLVLSACGHRSDVLKPMEVSDPTVGKVDMLVATTRAPSDNLALRYSGERGEYVHLDNIVVSIPPADRRKPGEIQWPSSARPDPKTAFVVSKANEMTQDGAMDWFRRTSGRKRRVLIFVHGFNTTYADAVFRFAQITHDIKTDAAPVLFTWPSRGNTLDYVYDKESTIYSRFGLVTLLEEATRSPDVSDITVLAHSMGTWLTMEALRDVALKSGRVSPKVRNVVLASPDIDVDVFKRQVIEMGEKRPRFTVYASRNDLALAASTFIAGDVGRLGSVDLRPYKAELAREGISVIDATDVQQNDMLEHNAFAENSDMLQALAARLAQQKISTAGDQTALDIATTGGRLVRSTISLPAKIVSMHNNSKNRSKIDSHF
ncbi:alpha/beta hydrolase [Shinella sp.]|uniref:alpha/beta hydrolase n=1 Tax=Shinella sp. TaxID=1870904 RepID=UPI003D2B4FBE